MVRTVFGVGTLLLAALTLVPLVPPLVTGMKLLLAPHQ